MPLIKVIIVDDHPMIREGLTYMLGSCPDIEIVDDCDNAEEAYRMSWQKRPDIILMDIKMEGKNGIEAARQILKDMPAIKIIFLTVFEDVEFIRQSLAAGGSGYVLKHVSKDKLIETIQRVYHGERVFDPTVFNHIVEGYIKMSSTPEEPGEVAGVEQAVGLTPREQEILCHLMKGMTNKEISAASHLAIDTVKTHLRNIFRKMGVKSRSQAITEGMKYLKIVSK
ncbi:MAG: response regulator transcription factor [Firmicutes bacterium]|nr:response regulator transcription factor [Bacillota bacterium]